MERDKPPRTHRRRARSRPGLRRVRMATGRQACRPGLAARLLSRGSLDDRRVAHPLASSSDAAAQLVRSLAVGIDDLLLEAAAAFGAAEPAEADRGGDDRHDETKGRSLQRPEDDQPAPGLQRSRQASIGPSTWTSGITRSTTPAASGTPRKLGEVDVPRLQQAAAATRRSARTSGRRRSTAGRAADGARRLIVNLDMGCLSGWRRPSRTRSERRSGRVGGFARAGRG